MEEVIPQLEIYSPPDGRICFWCLKPVYNSTKYHIIPAYLTSYKNHEYTLPEGVVCGECNSMFSIAEGLLVEFFQERLVFFNVPKRDQSPRKKVTSSMYDYVTVSPGKISYDLNQAGFTAVSKSIALRLKDRGFDSSYYKAKLDKDNNLHKKGLLYCVIAKIALEALYCFWSKSQGDKYIYEEILKSSSHNIHKHRKSIHNFINKTDTRVVNNVLMLGSKGGLYSDWNLNYNYLQLSYIESYPIIWVRILGLLFLVNYLPNGNKDLTENEAWELVKRHNNDKIKFFINEAKKENIGNHHIDKLLRYLIH